MATKPTVVSHVLRIASLALVTFIAGTAVSSTLVAPRPAAAPDGDIAVVAAAEGAVRSTQLARFRPILSPASLSIVVNVDGMQLTSAANGSTVEQVLRAAGIDLGPADRLSVPPDTKVVAGMRLVLDRGVPVTIVDGGAARETRARPGTVGEMLAASGIALGERDELATPAGAQVAAGAVVRITRVSERELVEREETAYPVRYVNDPALDHGREAVSSAGVPGQIERKYVIRYVDGVEAERSLVSAVQVKAPVEEVRRVGTKPRLVPVAPAEIEAIIRAAAARWGANPDQLLRVAWCESRFDPNAYNPGHGDSGLFQFIPGTWRYYSPRAGYAGVSVFDPVANANTAAMMFAQGEYRQWVCR